MIDFKKYTLDNGLRLIVHRDVSTPLAAVNVLYDVGSRDEHPDKTGFAHLFEHLMFGGSKHIPDYDSPLERAGGENNAFTSNDITNFYLTLPHNNLETAFWLESDRMLELAFDPKSLKVQRNVVIEEYKQRYLNQPYGDLWLLLRPLAYKVHPYQWATIGKDISHIKDATMGDVRTFYERFYHPRNAILSVVSGLSDEQVLKMTEKWFGSIRNGAPNNRNLQPEPVQTETRTLEVSRNVPFDTLTMAFHMSSRSDPAYYAQDMLSDILSSGRSTRLYEELVRKKRLFTEMDAFITGDIDNGLFVFTGKLQKGVTIVDAERSIWEQAEKIMKETPSEEEMQKARNRLESAKTFSDISILNRAFKIAYAELVNDPDLVNNETSRYFTVTPEDISNAARELFLKENCSILYYLAT
jgi:zinc protease